MSSSRPRNVDTALLLSGSVAHEAVRNEQPGLLQRQAPVEVMCPFVNSLRMHSLSSTSPRRFVLARDESYRGSGVGCFASRASGMGSTATGRAIHADATAFQKDARNTCRLRSQSIGTHSRDDITRRNPEWLTLASDPCLACSTRFRSRGASLCARRFPSRRIEFRAW
jgi:hypothetical protein